MTLTLNKAFHTFLFTATLGLTFFSCKTNNKSDNSTIQTANPNDLTPGPIVHDSLSTDQIEKIKKIQVTFSEVNPSSLEETITDFKRDRNPNNEIAIWLAMANAYEKFTSKRTTLDLNKKKEAYGLILMRSMANEAEAKAQSDLKLLTDEEVEEIFSYYKLEAKPITVEQK
jgi:hypothetical protein